MCTSPGRIRLSQKQDPYGRVHFSTSAPCREMHYTVYSKAKLNSNTMPCRHIAAVAFNGLIKIKIFGLVCYSEVPHIASINCDISLSQKCPNVLKQESSQLIYFLVIYTENM